MLNEKEFKILTYLLDNKQGVTQNKIAKGTGLSVGSVNKTVNYLIESNCISNYNVTDKGLEALEPYRVQNACFMAAGFGSRLVPITLNTPKPLVRVRGKRIIDSLLDACVEAEIPNIYIVRGYLKEQFDQLLEKYPMIHFIDNPLYNETNNISSALLLGDKISNSYMFEADLLLSNSKLITKYQYVSNYLGIYKERTDDYIFKMKNERIVGGGIGGFNCYQVVGISYWNRQDGLNLRNNIENVFYNVPGGKEKFFGSCVDYTKTYLTVRPCTDADVVEIDTFRELQRLDPAYRVEL
ncbi:MAG: winged helix-turn-helix transcriptional regulator [Lachnospiraceae bacterium]|nr:winged helix-turn-helix transcriptional regulator [Erysipelotrichaceae bacterium]MBR4342440.1 winged helix-turn-helix transcriptional regulator [Lachnospiraceae bacterium]